jgi:hypothetical protein
MRNSAAENRHEILNFLLFLRGWPSIFPLRMRNSAAENRHEILNFLLSLVLDKTDDSALQVTFQLLKASIKI